MEKHGKMILRRWKNGCFEIKLKLYLLKDIALNNLQEKICSFIDNGLAKNDELLKLHQQNKFKNYCFDSLFPIEKDKVYKKNKIYTLTIRTIDNYLAEFFYSKLVNEYDDFIKGLTTEIRIIPKKYIEKIYSITPAILKCENGYWKNNISFGDYERRLKENLIKKYNSFMQTKIDEDFPLYTSIEFKNNIPIASEYKNIKVLGDKLILHISEDELSQQIAYMTIGTGIFEMNARGYGFINYRWL